MAEAHTVNGTSDQDYMEHAGFWRRLAAFMIDTFPIQIVIFCIFYFFLGFDETLHNYMNGPRDFDSRLEFLTERNRIRDSTWMIWIAYCMIAEASPLQGTLGKRLMGMRVVDRFGRRPTIFQAFTRNLGKIISALPIFLGFIWAAWSGKKQGWHDKLSGCYVVITSAQ